jgi:hypothetical protein
MMVTLNDNPITDEKKRKWESIMAELNIYGSREGDDVPIDEGIKECIAALNMLGMPTTASCAGHPEDEGLGFPMVQGILENDPDTNRTSHEQAKSLVEEFNAGRSTPFTLHLHPDVINGFRIESIVGEEGEQMMVENEKGYDREKMRALGLGAQAEFQAFTEFLKGKTFGDT